jgi:hypothetical protein
VIISGLGLLHGLTKVAAPCLITLARSAAAHVLAQSRAGHSPPITGFQMKILALLISRATRQIIRG